MLANVPMSSSIGNHEGTGALFRKYFPYPYGTGRFYWSFDYGPAHFAVVDEYASYAPGSAQYTWLENDLRSSTKPWKFVYLHEPGWSAAGGHPNNADVQTYIQPLCERYGVPILFAGHNHYYARAVTYRSDNNAPLHHVTTGGGGAPLGTPISTEPNIVAASRSYHFCKINIVNNDELQFQAIDDGGAIIDQFTVKRTPATAISDLQAGNITSGSATITWTTNLSSSSTVEYGLHTGYGSTATGAGGVTGHSVSLTGLAPGATYHYRAISNGVASADNTFTTLARVDYAPTSAAPLLGSPKSGSYANLAANDGSYFSVNSTTGGTRQSDWYGAALVQYPAGVKRLTVTYDGKYSGTVKQILYLWDWSSSGWVLIDSRNIGTRDVTVARTLTIPANYISPAGEIRLRVYSSGGKKNYVCYGDFMQFTVETLP